jgi:hypothetical protein
VLRDFARQGHQLLVFTCHEHVWRMFQELKIDTRRIPNRFGDDVAADEAIVASALPEPVAVVEPEPVSPPPIEVEPIPTPVFEVPVADDTVMEIVDEADDVPPRLPPAELEVEYWWDSVPVRKSDNQVDVDETTAGDWMPEPVIHPQRW